MTDLLNYIDYLLIPVMILMLNLELSKKPIIKLKDETVNKMWLALSIVMFIEFIVWIWS